MAGRRGFQQIPRRHWERQSPAPHLVLGHGHPLPTSSGGNHSRGQRIFRLHDHNFEQGLGDLYRRPPHQISSSLSPTPIDSIIIHLDPELGRLCVSPPGPAATAVAAVSKMAAHTQRSGILVTQGEKGWHTLPTSYHLPYVLSLLLSDNPACQG